ncbi:MAG: cyclic nucleotide-binding domain-containing protein [Lachnospiraceae bacterium]|nr:cyclic nucleotide-binding domain-containing protein [Lachnospiraceae bacterium]
MEENVKEYKKGEIIFEEGTQQSKMYEVAYGKVGIYKDYGKASEVKLADINKGYFGEMGFARSLKRNATAVALEDTGVIEIDEKVMSDYFEKESIKVDILLQDLSKRVREADRKYVRACGLVDQYLTADSKGAVQDPELIAEMKNFVSGLA